MTEFANIDGVMSLLGLSQAQIAANVATLAHLARAEWVRVAKRDLHSTERDYTGAILPVQLHGMTALVILEGVFPNMLEDGWAPHDLRDTILRSGKAKMSKAGYRYMIIPFATSITASATGRNAPKLGSGYTDAFAAQRSKELAKALRKLSATTSTVGPMAPGALHRFQVGPVLPGGRKTTTWGQSLAAENAGPLARARHAAPLAAGTYRFEKGYAGGSQATYGSFRVISENPATKRSDSGGANWHHPGLVARHFVREVADYVAAQAADVFGGAP